MEWIVRVLVQVMFVRIVWIWAIRVCAVDHGPPHVLVLPVVIWLRTVCVMRTLVVGSGIVWLVVVCIVMRLRIEGVVAVMADTAWSWVVIVVVVSCRVRDVFYGILRVISHEVFACVRLISQHERLRGTWTYTWLQRQAIARCCCGIGSHGNLERSWR